MERILEFGGAPKCSDDQKQAFATQAANLVQLITAEKQDSDAINKALKDIGTLTIDFEGVKAPGFFQRVVPKCVLPLKDMINPPAPSSRSSLAFASRKNAVYGAASKSGSFDFNCLLDCPLELLKMLGKYDPDGLFSVFQGEIKPDWIRIGLSAGVLFLLVVVLLLLMRKPRTEYLR